MSAKPRAISDLLQKRRQRLWSWVKKRNQEKARQFRLEAQQEEDLEHAQQLEAMARNYGCHIDIPDMSDLRFAGTLLTAVKLYGTADQVSRSRDAEAIKTLGLKAATTAGKWALKLVRSGRKICRI